MGEWPCARQSRGISSYHGFEWPKKVRVKKSGSPRIDTSHTYWYYAATFSETETLIEGCLIEEQPSDVREDTGDINIRYPISTAALFWLVIPHK